MLRKVRPRSNRKKFFPFILSRGYEDFVRLFRPIRFRNPTPNRLPQSIQGARLLDCRRHVFIQVRFKIVTPLEVLYGNLRRLAEDLLGRSFATLVSTPIDIIQRHQGRMISRKVLMSPSPLSRRRRKQNRAVIAHQWSKLCPSCVCDGGLMQCQPLLCVFLRSR